jgi:ADP-ribose pyrophosphatase
MADRILLDTRYLRCIDRDGWCFVERPNVKDVVAIIAVTDDDRLVLVEQLRIPLGREIVELPAGLVGDEQAGEDPAVAAVRELREETGYEAATFEALATCPTSAGMTNETVTFFLATGLRKAAAGGGVGDERIRVYEVPLAGMQTWLRERERAGLMVASKVYAGLYFLSEKRTRPTSPVARCT